MPASNLLLIVEGPHDVDFCARLLKLSGFSRVQSLATLERDLSFWIRTVPKKWPHGDDLLSRHPVPLFLSNSGGDSVAIVNSTGISNIASRLVSTLSNLDLPPDAIGVVMDSDDTDSPRKRFQDLCNEIGGLQSPVASTLRWPANPGEVNGGPPKTGIFVIPDNSNQGTLEDLLLETAATSYPQLHKAAQTFVNGAETTISLSPEDLREFRKPAGKNKATTAAMASILKPGKSIQVSIQDNRWLDSASLALPRITAVKHFLERLFA